MQQNDFPWYIAIFFRIFFMFPDDSIDYRVNTDKYVNYELVLVEGRMVREGK